MVNKNKAIVILLIFVGSAAIYAQDFVQFEEVTLVNGRQITYVVSNNWTRLEEITESSFGINIRIAGSNWTARQERELDRVFVTMMRNNITRNNVNSVTALNAFMPNDRTIEIFVVNAERQRDGSIIFRETSWRFTR